MNTQMTERFNVSGALLVKLFGRHKDEVGAFSGSCMMLMFVPVDECFSLALSQELRELTCSYLHTLLNTFHATRIGMSIALSVISFTFFAGGENAPFVISGLAVYLAFFSLGMGPGCWLIPSEVFSTTIRAKAMSMATFLNRATATIMASTFLSMARLLSWAGFFFVLAVLCLCILLFFYVYLPETKGRSLEDMSFHFAELTGDRSILEAEMRHRQPIQHMDCMTPLDEDAIVV